VTCDAISCLVGGPGGDDNARVALMDSEHGLTVFGEQQQVSSLDTFQKWSQYFLSRKTILQLTINRPVAKFGCLFAHGSGADT
jgi:hypothetical protein